MRATRVAVLADVHGNAEALAAVLAEALAEEPDAIVHCGDLTWGPLPEETVRLLHGRDVHYVRGNADRAVLELAERLAAGPDAPSPGVTERERWMVEQHAGPLLELLRSFEPAIRVEIEGLGDVLFCHGSPRSDEELVTVETPEARLAEATAGVDADVVVTAHTHVRYVREALGRTFLNPGSVGMPYEGRPGAYWALLGPGIEHRCTAYDIDAAEARYRRSGDPLAAEMAGILRDPPTPAEVIAHAESLEFSG
jgi:putative phosphoesterase